jgi:hypothetical protein
MAGGFRYPLKATHRNPSAPSNPDPVRASLHEQRLNPGCEPLRNHQRPAGSACKGTFYYRSLNYIPPRCQPQTPSGQTNANIGSKMAVRANDKAQQGLAIVDLTGHQAAALRPALIGDPLHFWTDIPVGEARSTYS